MSFFDEFADEIGGEVIANTHKGLDHADPCEVYTCKLRAPLLCSTLTLFALHTVGPAWCNGAGVALPQQQSYTITAALPYVRSSNFRFAALPAERRGLKFFGDPRVKCPFAELESFYFCETNDAESLHDLFDTPELQMLLFRQRGARILVQQRTLWSVMPALQTLPDDVSLLTFNQRAALTRISQLRQIYALIANTYGRLIDLGLAIDAPPSKAADACLI